MQLDAEQPWATHHHHQQQQQVTGQVSTKPQLLRARPPWQGVTDGKRSGQQQDMSSRRTPGKASVQPAESSSKAGSAEKLQDSCCQVC
jgi:hypothetical protein